MAANRDHYSFKCRFISHNLVKRHLEHVLAGSGFPVFKSYPSLQNLSSDDNI